MTEYHRSNPAQVMREAIANERARKQHRRQWWLSVATHALYFVVLALGTIALAIN